ncbi:MAG: hypothetical protein E7359_03515 [Clostridiales bacterium]|nr:hypothetical protein [Clostridiales bacterium]
MEITVKNENDLLNYNINEVTYMIVAKNKNNEYCIKVGLNNFELPLELNASSCDTEFVVLNNFAYFENFFDKGFMPNRYDKNVIINFKNVEDLYLDFKEANGVKKYSMEVEFKNGTKLHFTPVKDPKKYIKYIEEFKNYNKIEDKELVK